MPHSSGGGSHGGGFHGGGSHGGGGGNRVSKHYFYGARRYRRHHRRTGEDEYVYASSRPRRTSLSSILIVAAVGVIFFLGIGLGTHTEAPKRLNGLYDSPQIYDDAHLIENEDVLMETIKEYYVQTGICPVIYTVYDDDWSASNPALSEVYEDLETYAYFKYVDNFTDEQHFVIVYSVSIHDAELMRSGKIDIPNYSWEACQGDDTDPIITEGMFRRFGHLVQDELEKGDDPGDAFAAGFRFAISDAESRLSPTSPSRIIGIIRSFMPMLFVGALIIPMLVLSIRNYIKDRDVEYEEVPFDREDTVSYADGQGLNAGAYTGTYTGASGYRSESSGVMPKVVSIISLVFVIPFILTGLIFIGVGIFMGAEADRDIGGFLLVFGILWTVLSAGILFGSIRALIKNIKKKPEDTLTAEYPSAEYPHAEYPKSEYPQTEYPGAAPMSDNDPVNAFTPSQDAPSPFVPLKDQPEFDQRFFESAKSDIEEDDEDYKRMKRKGFE